MPMVVPVSEMQKNGAHLVDTAMQTREPIYLTRHGYKSVVLVDADEYDRLAEAEIREMRRALATKEGIDRGRREVLEGRVIPLDDALSQLEQKWGDPR